MKGGEAGRDAAGIRLDIEAVSDSPNGDRETVRDEDESHVRKESVIDPLAVGRFVTARLDLIRGYGLAESRRPSCIIMLRRNGLPTTLEGAAKTILGATSVCSQGSAAAAPKAFIGCALIGAGCGDRLAW